MSKTPLYQQIRHMIRSKIMSGELRPKDRVPSEQEIMEEYMVSKITVKNALSALADEGLIIRIQGKGTFVSPEIELMDRTKPLEQTRGQQDGNYIGFIIPTLKTKVIQRLLDHVEYYINEAGYQLVLHITRESSLKESRAISELIQSKEIKGFIVFPTEDETYNESLLRLSLDKFPLVLIDRYLRNIDTYRITADNFGGVYEAVSLLLKKDHKQIALISPDKTNTSIEDRTSGFERAYVDNGMLIDKSLWCHVPIHLLRNGDPLAYITDFLHHHSHISAALTLTAEMTNLTHQGLHNLDRNSDIKLISFDDPDLLGIPFISQDEQTMARSAVDILIKQIQGEYDPLKIVVPVSLKHVDPELL